MAGIRFTMPVSNVDLSSKVRNDPFTRLPHRIIFKICRLLYDENVPDLAKASWAVHSITRDNGEFWKDSLKYNLVWFSEIQELMRLGALRRPEKYKAIYLWAIKIWTKNGMEGPIMHVANRRRIWLICDQLSESYWAGQY
ncbi:hypothetical protein F5Y05DRAFT_337784 [Hypoxylon sp. FL0543]|nr:hypothetical protein F5Y05DRAFT_337784 [Hypoxylon sp. FL0543]